MVYVARHLTALMSSCHASCPVAVPGLGEAGCGLATFALAVWLLTCPAYLHVCISHVLSVTWNVCMYVAFVCGCDAVCSVFTAFLRVASGRSMRSLCATRACALCIYVCAPHAPCTLYSASIMLTRFIIRITQYLFLLLLLVPSSPTWRSDLVS